MFSFFKSSAKKSPVVTPTQADDGLQKNSDGFEIIGNTQPQPLYPSAQLPARPPPPQTGHSPSLNRQISVSTNYASKVPFKLNPALIAPSNNDVELWGFKIREITATVQRATTTDYDFRLERSILGSS